jgi:hypothetical protein
MYREWKKMEFSNSIIYEFESTRPRGRPRNRWQDEVRENGKIVGVEELQEKVYNREEWKEAPENGKDSSHSAHGNGMDELKATVI